MIIVIFLIVCSFTSAIVLKDNGYEDVNIVIQDSVDENWKLIERIKKVFTDASKYLFKATENRVYYRKINIIVPKTWNVTRESFSTVPSLLVKGFVTVEEGKLETPHVKKQGCGKDGLYMYLRPSFLLETEFTKWGNPESVIVHEWGHLRWGLYDEYRQSKKEQFYQDAGQWKPVGCTDNVKGRVGRVSRCSDWQKDKTNKNCDVNNTAKKMHSKCMFCPSFSQSTNTSIMSYQFIPSFTLFCDKDDPATPEWKRHNRRAPNMQNKMCGRKSAWEVMREHEDFANGASPILPIFTDTSPEFNIVQEKEALRVLVLDVSGSMSGSRIENLNVMGKFMVQEVLRNDSWLGIVWFNSTATLAKEIVQITDASVREQLIQNLPNNAGGGTCIGCGINLAIEMLEKRFGFAKGCQIMLMSDGSDTNAYQLAAATQSAISTGVVIHAMSISQAADSRMINLASDTGGKHFNYFDQGSISLTAIFSEAVTGGVTEIDNQAVTILSDSVRIPSDRLDFAFIMETGLGKRTSVSVLTSLSATLNMMITGTDSIHKISNVGKSLTWNVERLEAGEYNVTALSSSNHTWDYIVKSFPSEPHPILVTSRLSTTKVDFSLESVDLPVLYVDVTKGKAPVVGAIIEAHVEASSVLCTLSPKDNGQDPDSLEEDGTYSVYLLPKCLTNGRLNVRVLVNGQANGTSVIKSINGASALDESEVEQEIISDSFQRFSLPEPIFIKNFSTNKSDTVAPGQITDVKIMNIATRMTSNGESRNFTISWTATGNDMNNGQASAYEIRYANDIDTIFNNFSSAYTLDIGNVSLTPKQSGMMEAIVISVNAEKTYVDTAYLGIVAVDETGNQGKVSNIVSVVVAKGFRMNFEGKTNNTEFEDEIITSPATTVTTEIVTAMTVGTDAVTATTVGTDPVTATTVTTENVTATTLETNAVTATTMTTEKVTATTMTTETVTATTVAMETVTVTTVAMDAVTLDVSYGRPNVDDSHTGLIVGVSVGVLAGMVVVGLILFVILRKRKQRSTYEVSRMGHTAYHEYGNISYVTEN